MATISQQDTSLGLSVAYTVQDDGSLTSAQGSSGSPVRTTDHDGPARATLFVDRFG
eukprot:SAG11_NODE_192_length_12931_cov_5.747682_3_plen_56_part_00